MSEVITLTLQEAHDLSYSTLRRLGLSTRHAEALAETMVAGQRDGCQSHGLYRLLVCAQTIASGKVVVDSEPRIADAAPSIAHVDAGGGYSILAFRMGLPVLVEKAASQGIAALAINNCVHFSALWPEVEAIAEAGMVGIAMTPSHSWVAPAGGTKPVFGTNPIAFAWPRKTNHPFVFDFATSAVARGEIELHRRSGKLIPHGWAVDRYGGDTNDPAAALEGAMLTFGGHKGSALAAMIELMAGPMIGDLTSLESQAHDDGAGASPFHGELLLAIDPRRFPGNGDPHSEARAEAMFSAIVEQGARLPSQRRYEAREISLMSNSVDIPASLHRDIVALSQGART